MKKFLMTLAAVALATGAIMAQTPANNTALEEPDRIQTRHLSMNPSGTDIPTGYDKPQAVAQKHECKKGEGQQCDKAAIKHECKKGEGQQCDKPAMKHECKKGEGHQCDKASADKSNVKAVKKSGKMMIKKDGKNDIKRDGAKDLKKESPKIPKKD